jgi:hypothetical protein
MLSLIVHESGHGSHMKHSFVMHVNPSLGRMFMTGEVGPVPIRQAVEVK